MDLRSFNVVEAGVEVDGLLVHLVKFDTVVGGELLEQLLHGDGGGGHGCPKDQVNLRVPV
jgi:hypothetical protein